MNKSPTISVRQPHDFYPTDPKYIVPLLRHVNFTGPICEPCCGDGIISTFLENQGYEVISSDLISYGYSKSKLIDFFHINEFNNIITNPPYKNLNDFLRHCFDHTKAKIALLLALSALESIERLELYKQNPPLKVIVIAERMKVHGKTSRFAHCWMVWDKLSNNNFTQLIFESSK